MTKLFFSILLVMGFLVSSSAAYADKLCIRKKIRSSDTAFAKKFRKISSGSCPRGFKELIDTSSFPGDAGADGADGQAGELRIYGNGARGALSVSGATALTGANHQFTDITINPGAVFTVPSGAVLRCTGTFTNNGTITVTRFAAGASRLGASNSDIELSASSAHPGSTACPAGSGAFGTNADTVLGAPEGCGLNQVSAANILDPGPLGGGGGGAGGASTFVVGGSGGGTLTVLCKTAIANSGIISATGDDGFYAGSGGGGGGIVLLASPGSITNSGTITTDGGAGGDSDIGSGAGGGGGGGTVHFISPSITQTGSVTCTGGAYGDTTTVPTDTRRFGGGAGGDGSGAGGRGATILADNSSATPTQGAQGLFIQTLSDPTALF